MALLNQTSFTDDVQPGEGREVGCATRKRWMCSQVLLLQKRGNGQGSLNGFVTSQVFDPKRGKGAMYGSMRKSQK